MDFTHTLVTLEALELARTVARLDGGEKYLQKQAKEISDALLAREHMPKAITHREGSQWVKHELKRTVIAPGVTRRLSAKNRDAMRRAYPEAYRAAVTETPPERAYHSRLDALRGGTASGEWADHRSQGATDWAAKLGRRFGDRDWTQPGVRAQTLYDLRQLRLAEEKQLDKAKVALVDFIIANELPLVIPGMRDGKIVLRENGPHFAVDYDLLEKRFGPASTLITRTATKGSERIDFTTYVPTPDDPDDSDDSAYGRSYTGQSRWH